MPPVLLNTYQTPPEKSPNHNTARHDTPYNQVLLSIRHSNTGSGPLGIKTVIYETKNPPPSLTPFTPTKPVKPFTCGKRSGQGGHSPLTPSHPLRRLPGTQCDIYANDPVLPPRRAVLVRQNVQAGDCLSGPTGKTSRGR